MGIVRRNRQRASTRRSVKTRTRGTVSRPIGAFGIYRGTRAMAPLRRAKYKISRALTPFPNAKLVRHKYVDTVSIAASAAATPQMYQFRCNSVFDPDYTGVGHQPMFHDEMAAQYKYYTVLRSRIKLTFSSGSTQDVHYVLWVDDDATVPTDASTCMEQHGSSYSFNRLDRRSSPLSLNARWNGPAWLKTSRTAYLADDTQRIPVGSNPAAAQAKYYNMMIYHPTGTALQALTMKVEMMYYVMWRDPVDHAGS